MSASITEQDPDARSAAVGGSNAPILIVDDNAAKRLALRALLAPLGHMIVEADSGLAALRCVTARNFALILLDVHMPIMDGFETAALIRKRRQSELTPIIFITAYKSDEIVTRDLYAEGAVDFIYAPVPPEQLRSKVSAFVSLFLQAESLASRAREVQTSAERLRAQNQDLAAMARQDLLTGLGNRRALEQDLALLEARVTRYGHRYCLAVIDVDHFKSYNDARGHQAGDTILRMVGARLREEARAGDAVYRYGGDEFVCILAEQSLATGAKAVERMRTGIQALAIPHAGNPLLIVTMSAGLAILGTSQLTTAREVLEAADAALYRAKQLGRNRVETPFVPSVSVEP